MYIADIYSYRIRKVTISTGIITTYAGNGDRTLPLYSGDGGAATSAKLDNPYGIAFDSAGTHSLLLLLVYILIFLIRLFSR